MPSAAQLEAVLRRHVLEAWFPRSLDTTHGGFLCDFDRRWTPLGPHDKLLEFHGRHLCVAADACRQYPQEPGYRQAMEHGFKYLREVLWDDQAGGWFHCLDRNGRVLEHGTKHAHGIAYGLDACAAVYEASRDPAALELAKAGFHWLEEHAWDREHGGHFGFLTREGKPILEPAQCPWPTELDTIGTPVGLKDLNVHCDLLETFIRLYRIWPDPAVATRLAESVEIIGKRMLVPESGALHYYVTPDWRPIPHLVRAGYQFQAAYRLTMAPDLTGASDELRRTAITLVDHILRHSRDDNGGFYYAAPGALPLDLQGQNLSVRLKPWWVQVEGLKTFLVLSRLAPENPQYLREFDALWEVIENQYLDARHGGVFAFALRRRHRLLGISPKQVTAKGHSWKDARHEARALLTCIEMLRENH